MQFICILHTNTYTQVRQENLQIICKFIFYFSLCSFLLFYFLYEYRRIILCSFLSSAINAPILFIKSTTPSPCTLLLPLNTSNNDSYSFKTCQSTLRLQAIFSNQSSQKAVNSSKEPFFFHSILWKSHIK